MHTHQCSHNTTTTRKMIKHHHNVNVVPNTVHDLTKLQFALNHCAPTKPASTISRMFAACSSSSHKAKERQASCAFWSLELHISYGRSSRMTCTAAWTFHACHRQHILAEAVSEAEFLQTLTCLSSCHLCWCLAAAPSLHISGTCQLSSFLQNRFCSKCKCINVQEHALFSRCCNQPKHRSKAS